MNKSVTNISLNSTPIKAEDYPKTPEEFRLGNYPYEKLGKKKVCFYADLLPFSGYKMWKGIRNKNTLNSKNLTLKLKLKNEL